MLYPIRRRRSHKGKRNNIKGVGLSFGFQLQIILKF